MAEGTEYERLMDNLFEYEGLFIRYRPDQEGAYELRSIDYDYEVGWVYIKEGPGAVIEMEDYHAWMDWSTAQAVTNFLADLNETIKE